MYFFGTQKSLNRKPNVYQNLRFYKKIEEVQMPLLILNSKRKATPTIEGGDDVFELNGYRVHVFLVAESLL